MERRSSVEDCIDALDSVVERAWFFNVWNDDEGELPGVVCIEIREIISLSSCMRRSLFRNENIVAIYVQGGGDGLLP